MTAIEEARDTGGPSEGDALLAARIARLGGEDRRDVVRTLALCLAELRSGAVCVPLADPPEAGGPWPEADRWRAMLAASPLVAAEGDPGDRPLRLIGDRLYLQRYWRDEQLVREVLLRPGPASGPPADAVEAALRAMFPGQGADDEQVEAARAAATSPITLLAGGPGTGKTWTVARIIAVLAALGDGDLRVAVAAPTGKAATRLQQAIANERPAAAPEWIGQLEPSTIHRLLRRRPGSHETFGHNRANPLPHDVVIVDEMSMVSLPLMARLLEAVRPTTRLVLVGDPDQLASVEAGSVFGDLARMTHPGARLVTLRRNHRFTGNLQVLAQAVRDGRTEEALAALTAGGNVEFVESADGSAALEAIAHDAARQALAIDAAAAAGDAGTALAALDTFRVLCAHRSGRHGVERWSGLIEQWGAAATGRRRSDDPWYCGRPLMVARNDYDLGVFNGETGVVIASGGRLEAVIDQGDSRTRFSPTQLTEVETLHAMTIHKAQGSQYRRVTVILPPQDSPLLTRELLYTAITRAQDGVRIVGTAEAVRAAVGRRVRRASGLGA